MGNDRSASLKILTSCIHCGAPLPVNGPVLSMQCSSCLKELQFPPALWERVLGRVDRNLIENSRDHHWDEAFDDIKFSIRWDAETPSCEQCHLPLAVATRNSLSVTCGGCLHETEVIRRPPWMEYEQLEFLWGTQSGPAKTSRDDSPKPIAMSCPSCGAALRITVDFERVCGCAFCQTDFYIPDPIWQKLHPAKIATTWFATFSGTPDWQRQLEYETQQALEQQDREKRLEADRQRLMAENRIRERKMERLKVLHDHIKAIDVGWGSWFLTLGAMQLALSLAVAFLIPIPLISDSYCRSLGRRFCDGEIVKRTRGTGKIGDYDCVKGRKKTALDTKIMVLSIAFMELALLAILITVMLISRQRDVRRIRHVREEIQKLE